VLRGHEYLGAEDHRVTVNAHRVTVDGHNFTVDGHVVTDVVNRWLGDLHRGGRPRVSTPCLVDSGARDHRRAIRLH
jgi:hypothetical protein